MESKVREVSNRVLSVFAGLAAFALTMLGFLLLGTIDQQIAASLVIGVFALVIVRLAAERPNSDHVRAVDALVGRLLAVGRGDLSSPAPSVVRQQMPALAAAVDGLFEQVRSTLDDVHAMAMYDPVTAIPNRIHFRREAERVLAAVQPESEAALLFIDLDGFKEVNDRLGHAQGDQVLVMVANRLRIVLQAETGGRPWQPLLARLAGDEFTMLLPAVGREEAERIAGRAVEALSEPFGSGGSASWLGASIGIALAPEHGVELPALMKAADVAMYHAKATGRSRTCVYHPELALACERRAGTDAAFRAAVADERFALLLDPQLCLRSGAITGAEAVVRWRGEGGLNPLPAIEDRALGVAVADWSLRAAAAAVGEWRLVKLPHRLSLRLDAEQVARPGLGGRLRELFGAPPWPLELELSEALVGAAHPEALAELGRLRDEGLSLALTDVGAGGAPLSVLSGIGADRVKLAPELVRDIERSERARVVLSSLVHLVRALGSDAVATGVERQEQLEVLRAVGCGTVQGFLGVEPMDEADFAVWAAAQDCAHSLARAS
ncbi:MAG: putative bifunctional diguanylate cyclase/phosphodiesterase [Allosphingosinicella sp.]